MRKILCFFCLCVISLLVCGWGNADDKASSKQETVVLDEIREEGVRQDSLGQEFEILEYIFEMPEAECFSEQAAKEIQKWQEEELALFWQEVKDQTAFEDDRFREIKSDPDEEKQIWWGPGLYHVEYSAFESDGLISFLKREYQLYTSAPHEILDDSAVIFDSSTGERITSDQLLDGLIGEGEEKRIYLSQYLIELLIPEEIGLYKDYRDKLVYEMLFRPECYVKDDALMVFFDTYDIATYPAGDIFLEVPLDKLAHLDKEIEDKTAAADWIQKLHKPGEHNQYLVEISENKAVRADLDGDGKEEVIFYPSRKTADDTNPKEIVVSINGRKITLSIEENIDKEAVGLVDIDREDGEYELAVRVDGRDSGPATVFFGYYGGELREIDRVDFKIDRESTNSGEARMDGSGSAWGNHDYVDIHKNAEILEEITEEGSRMDSFYQESLLLEYDFYMPQVEGLSILAAEKIKEWQEREFDAFMQKMEEWALLADSDCLERLTDPDEEKRGWGVPCIYSVKYTVFQSAGVVSFLKQEYQCYGPSHGDTLHSGRVFDSRTGEELSIDYFLDEGENGRIALAQYLIEQVDGEYLWKDYEEHIVYRAVFDPQFYVEGDTLVFLFSQDEMASHAYGPIFLEVPLDGKRELKDQKAIEKWAEDLQIPGKTNRYLVELPAGQTVTVDLDGDGQEEEIYYPIEKSAVENTSMEIALIISEEKFLLTVDENIIRESIGLVDINSEDGKYELAIRATGPSDDYVTAFYRYENGEIKEIGRTGCVIDRDSTNAWKAYLRGDGSIYGDRTLGILEIRQLDARWELDPKTDTLQLYEKKNYNYSSDNWLEPFLGWRWEHPYKLTGGILIYDQMDRTSEHMTITGKKARIIQFLSTDGKNWVEAEIFMNGEFKRGWLYIKDFIEIEVGEDQFAPCYDRIKNLQGAG